MAEPTPQAVAALAKVLSDYRVEIMEGRPADLRDLIAQRILTDPGPLLAALAQAGVLEERHQIVCSCGSIRTGTWRPHHEADVHDMTRERCYVTKWKPVSE